MGQPRIAPDLGIRHLDAGLRTPTAGRTLVITLKQNEAWETDSDDFILSAF